VSPTSVEKLIKIVDSIKLEEDVLIFGDDEIRAKTAIQFKAERVGIVPISASNIILAD
jgi:hypothetical protein